MSSIAAPAAVPMTSTTNSAGQYGQPDLPTRNSEERGDRHADVADREVDDPTRPVDEHDAHREHRHDQSLDQPEEQKVGGPDVGLQQRREHQPPSVPKNTARARSSRSSELARRTFELHLALLEEDRAVGDGERDVQRLLDDDHRLAACFQHVDEFEHALHDDRREAERQLVDEQDLRGRACSTRASASICC